MPSAGGASSSPDRPDGGEVRRRRALSRIWAWLLVPLAGAVFALSLIWVPEFAHYWTPTPTTSEQLVASLRDSPGDDVLSRIAGQSLAVDLPGAPVPDVVADANALLKGEWRVSPTLTLRVDPEFRVDDFLVPGGTDQLRVASLSSIDLLLKAYERTGSADYLRTATTYLRRFAALERSIWLPTGFIWNDHAIAARCAVLVRFWRAYRRSGDFDPEVAGEILTLVRRSGALLAKPSHYTFATNHGVMQNIGLLQFAAAFPALPEAPEWRRLAASRLDRQFRFYVNGEGVVLEHSAGYHHFGVRLLEMATELVVLNGDSVPAVWQEKLAGATEFLRRIARPDGSLPVFGNTDRAERVPPQWRPSDPDHVVPAGNGEPGARPDEGLYPGAGYSVWWQPAGAFGPSQTVMLWSYFQGHGHKHADELSINVWAAARDWVGNVGYWPYHLGARRAATGWAGANAPHLAGEAVSGARTSRVISVARGSTLQFIEVRRADAGGRPVVERQLLGSRGTAWLVIDSASDDRAADLDVDWTFAPGLLLRERGGAYLLEDPVSRDAMRVTVAAGQVRPGLRTVRGSVDPFGGWVVDGGRPVVTDGLLVRLPKPATWLATVFELVGEGRGMSAVPAEIEVDGRESWRATLAADGQRYRVERHADRITVSDPEGRVLEEVPVVPWPSNQQDDVVLSSFAEERRASVLHRDLLRYRKRASNLIAGLFAASVAGLLAIRRFLPSVYRAAVWGAAAGWFGSAFWLWGIYLR